MSKPHSQGGEKGTDTNQASELFELCKEVHKRTKLPIAPGMFHFDKDGYVRMRSYGHGVAYLPGNGDVPLYTSDYLLEKLASDYSIEAAVKYVSHGTKDSLYRYMVDKLGKFVAFTPDISMGRYPVGDKPVIPLLKLTIALSEAGELK